MEKQGSQLELFSQEKGVTDVKRHRFSLDLFTHFHNYEKAIFLIIIFVITGIISFTLGVERGKRINLAASGGIVPNKVNIEAKVANEPVPEPPVEQEKFLARKTAAINEVLTAGKKNYTIQLASYKTTSYAQKEADLLKKKGFSAVVMPRGKYVILCVGTFSDKETAQPLLSELKKKYEGCYIRRL
ncbi:MAG: SPOR domain-containing protein [Candidatus Omnitrophota bacterium]